MERDERMNVWIKGDNTNPTEVINTLLKVGGINSDGYTGVDSYSIYYIDEYDNITNRDIHAVESYCIMNTFKEVKPEIALKDKQLVWCWDDEELVRAIRFYDAVNNCTFDSGGYRKGSRYDHYEPYTGEYPEWAKEAVKQLQN